MEFEEDGHRDRVALAVYQAVVKASRRDADVVFIRSGSVFDALMMVATVFVAGAPDLKTSHDVWIFCENACARMRQEIDAAREDPDRSRLFGEAYDPVKVN